DSGPPGRTRMRSPADAGEGAAPRAPAPSDVGAAPGARPGSARAATAGRPSSPWPPGRAPRWGRGSVTGPQYARPERPQAGPCRVSPRRSAPGMARLELHHDVDDAGLAA